MVFLRGPSTSHHTYTRTQPHVTAGGGRGKLSTVSGNQATDAKQAPGLTSKEWSIVVNAGTIVAITGIGTFMWQVIERLHQAEVARIKGEAETAQRLDKAEVARIKGEAETAVARIKGEAETAQRLDKAEVARIKGEAETAVARIKGEAKGDAARLEDKVENCRYFVQALGTRDHEPLEKALSQRQKEKEERSQAMATGESAGKERKE